MWILKKSVPKTSFGFPTSVVGDLPSRLPLVCILAKLCMGALWILIAPWLPLRLGEWLKTGAKHHVLNIRSFCKKTVPKTLFVFGKYFFHSMFSSVDMALYGAKL